MSGLGLSVADDGELSTGDAVATGSLDDSSVGVAGESGGPPPSDDVSLASVENPLDAGGVGADERASPAVSRRVEAGSIMGVESPDLLPCPSRNSTRVDPMHRLPPDDCSTAPHSRADREYWWAVGPRIVGLAGLVGRLFGWRFRDARFRLGPATPPSAGGGSVGSYSEYAEVAVTPPDSEGNDVGNRAGSVGWNT